MRRRIDEAESKHRNGSKSFVIHPAECGRSFLNTELPLLLHTTGLVSPLPTFVLVMAVVVSSSLVLSAVSFVATT